jgi:hypothetical protein
MIDLHERLSEFSFGYGVTREVEGLLASVVKLGEELSRFHRATPSQSIPFLERPFWRYRIDTTSHQFGSWSITRIGIRTSITSPPLFDLANREPHCAPSAWSGSRRRS